MKVAKEQIVGMVAAVDWILSQSDEGMEKEFRSRANKIAAMLKDIPSLTTEVSIPPLANHIPHLLIRYSQDRVKVSPRDVMTELRKGQPVDRAESVDGPQLAGIGGHDDGREHDRGRACGCSSRARS